VAARVAALGAGTTVDRQDPAGELRDTASHVMATATFRAAARELARLIEPERGANNGASALEAWLMSPASGC
jgi:UDP:flavonoid glycosyltransferase YjiC (YdhE family)